MIHHVFANRKNIGDLLSARGIQALLDGEAVVEHLCDEPHVEGTLGRLSQATEADVVVIGGGGLFMDYFTPFWQGFAELAERLPYVIWGAGFVDLKREPSRGPAHLLTAIAQRSRLCVVRDELSRSLLGAGELPPPVPCPSVVAVETAPAPGFGLLHVVNLTTVGAEAYEAMRAVGEQFAWATGREYRELNNRIHGGNGRREEGLAAILARYRASDVVLTSRLHGCIVALATGRRVVAVSGDWKVEAFMEAAGLREWVLDAGEVDALLDRLHDAGSQPTPTGFLDSVRTRNAEVARRVLELAREPR